MKDILLIALVLIFLIPGCFFMKKIDAFFEENYQQSNNEDSEKEDIKK